MPTETTKPKITDPSPAERERVAFRLGAANGRAIAFTEAADLIRKMARERSRSDVNAIKAACALLEKAGVTNAE